MTYVIVTGENTIVGMPARSYVTALNQAARLYGSDVATWLRLNLRVEERRPDGLAHAASSYKKTPPYRSRTNTPAARMMKAMSSRPKPY